MFYVYVFLFVLFLLGGIYLEEGSYFFDGGKFCVLSNSLLYFFLSFYSKLYFSINSFMKKISVSNILDPYQARRFVGPDMVSNCLQKMLTLVSW